jgi:hypothetical protein
MLTAPITTGVDLHTVQDMLGHCLQADAQAEVLPRPVGPG